MTTHALSEDTFFVVNSTGLTKLVPLFKVRLFPRIAKSGAFFPNVVGPVLGAGRHDSDRARAPYGPPVA